MKSIAHDIFQDVLIMTQFKTKAKVNSTTQLSKGHFTFILGYVVEDATVTVNRRTAMKSPFLYLTFA